MKLICFRNGVHSGTKISEDVFQMTMEILCGKPAEEIIEAFENDQGRPDRLDRLVALCVTIAIRKGVYRGDNDNPKTSLLNLIYHNSAIKTMSDEAIEESELVDLKDESQDRFELNEERLEKLLREKLTKAEYKFLQHLQTAKKGPGRYKKEMQEKREKLRIRIKDIIHDYKYNDNG